MTPVNPMDCAPLPEKLYGILGRPLGHSLSPLLHNRAFRTLGHAASYFAWEKTADELQYFFAAVRALPISGLSVTIPYKEAVIPFLDGLTAEAGKAGAVNTVFWQEGRLMGHNSDVGGFLSPLRERGTLPGSALLLGAGGACRAALAGLRELGFRDIAVAARKPEKARALARDFNCEIIPWSEREQKALDLRPLLLINATPIGMKGVAEGESPVPGALWTAIAGGGAGEDSLAYDLVYSPARTVFLAQAGSAGIPVLDGLAFFVAQAMEQLRLWTGEDLPGSVRDEARATVEEQLCKV